MTTKAIPAVNKTQMPMKMTAREIVQPAPAKPAKTFQEALYEMRTKGYSRELAEIVIPRVSDYVCRLVSVEGKLDYAEKLLRIRTLQRDDLRAALAAIKGDKPDVTVKPIDVTARLAAVMAGRTRGWTPGVKLGAG